MIQWLIDQVNLLKDRIVAAVNNAYYWAKTKAQAAYNNAVVWAKGKIDTLSSIVWNLYSAAKTHATNLFNSTTSTILYWYDRAVAKAKALAQDAKNITKVLFDSAVVSIKYWYDRAVAGAQALVQGAKDVAVALWNDGKGFVLYWINQAAVAAQGIILGIRDTILALINRGKVEFEEFKATVGIDEPAKQGTLLHFLQSPGSFILAYVWSMFLSFLEWSLAYAIGSMDEPLPSIPNWFDGGFGGVIPTGTGPPPGASGLAPPLDSLRVSGWSFIPGHPGIDLGLAMGTPVYAMHSGVIEIATWSTIGYGFYVTIRSDEWWTLYAHLDVINVSPGQSVKQSDRIGLGNSTGRSTGPHLHLEIKHRGQYIDPVTVL